MSSPTTKGIPKATRENQKESWRKVLNSCSLALLIFFMIIIVGTTSLQKISSTNTMAKGAIRTLAYQQQRFQDNEGAGNYGTFEDLKTQLYYPEDYSLDDLCEQHIVTMVVSSSGESFSDDGSPLVDRFIITAIPKPGSSWTLRTYAITEDMESRVFTPKNGNDPDDVRSWDVMW